MKYIKDYPRNGTVGIKCSSEEEWKAIVKLMNGINHPIYDRYLQYDTYNTIGIYDYEKGNFGWNSSSYFPIVFRAKDFLEVQFKIY